MTARTNERSQDRGISALCEHVAGLARELPGPVSRIAVRSADSAVEVEWTSGAGAGLLVPPGGEGYTGTPPRSSTEEAYPDDAPDSHVVSSPLVGTFYRAPRPGAAPFVSVGDLVAADDVVGIVEAMKLMNRIVATVRGRVAEIFVDNGAAVEFEQPLLRIVTADASDPMDGANRVDGAEVVDVADVAVLGED
jgi:acetyl-CoA carboxylase biotin carboxyl carrier protein